MEPPLSGDVVVLPFPFSDLSQAKRRPAVVVSVLPGDDLILCQVTSQATGSDPFAVPISGDDFEQGRLDRQSYARPSRLFTADRHLLLYRAARLRGAKRDEIVEAIVAIIRGQTQHPA